MFTRSLMWRSHSIAAAALVSALSLGGCAASTESDGALDEDMTETASQELSNVLDEDDPATPEEIRAGGKLTPRVWHTVKATWTLGFIWFFRGSVTAPKGGGRVCIRLLQGKTESLDQRRYSYRSTPHCQSGRSGSAVTATVKTKKRFDYARVVYWRETSGGARIGPPRLSNPKRLKKGQSDGTE